MGYQDLGIKTGMTIHLHSPAEDNPLEKAVCIGEWKTPIDDFQIGESIGDLETYNVFDQETLEWVKVNVNVAGPIDRFTNGIEAMVLLNKQGTSYYEHYQTVAETEKAICVSLDGSDWCNAWIPKSVIIGKTRQRSTRDLEAMKTPIKTAWAIANQCSGGPIRA